MPTPIRTLHLTASAALLAGLMVLATSKIDAGPMPKLPPLPKGGATGKGPLPPGIKDLVGDPTIIINIPGYKPQDPPLKQALHITRHVRNKELIEKDLKLDVAGKQVRVAEELVAQQAKVPKKGSKRAQSLDKVAKDLHQARIQIADHKVDDARNTLQKAVKALDGLVSGKKSDPKKKDKK